MRVWIGPAEPAIHRITGTEDRGSLLIGNLFRNEISCVGIHQHVLGVSALYLNSCALLIGTEHSAATLAPFAPSARGLNPRGTDAVAHLSRGDVRAPDNNSPARPGAGVRGKCPGNVPTGQS